MAYSNKKSGTAFEKRLAELYSGLGYWVHLLEPGKDGSQPADLILVGTNDAYLEDAKVLDNKTGRFPISRIEPNQRSAYHKWCACGNSPNKYRVSILWQSKVYTYSMEYLLHGDRKSISLLDIDDSPGVVQFEDIHIQ